MMKFVRFVAFFVLMFGSSRTPVPAHEQIRTTDVRSAEQRLKDIQQELMRAWIARDRARIEGFLAPDWFVTGPTGAMTARAEVLADVFERGVHRVWTGRISDVSVRLIGSDAAVITGLTNATGTYAGTPYTAEIRFTDTFERHGTDWRAVRSHASSISK